MQKLRTGPSGSDYLYHVAVVAVIIIWGVTFISTKILINNGLSPVEIFFYRFAMAYVGIWFIGRQALFCHNIKDELLCAGLGFSGGTLYFIFENTALEITLASNVSLLVSTSPLFTALLVRMFFRNEKIKNSMLVGTLIALVGVALVVFNGKFILQINPLGDVLSLLSALSWGLYGLFLRGLSGHYSTLLITRKCFFYGLVTVVPFLVFKREPFNFETLAHAEVIGNLLFLGLGASLACFVVWNKAVTRLGVVQTSNYIYFIPPITLVASALILDEQITYVALIGCALILAGIYISEKGRFRLKKA